MPFVLPSTFLVLFLFILANSLRVLREYERGVVFRLGRFVGTRGPGLIILVPFIERMVKVSLRTVTMDVPPQDVITRDNVSVRVNAVLYFRVMEPERAIIDVEDFLFATSQLAQTTLRSVVGQAELDELLAKRDKLNAQIQTILDEATDPWGIKVVDGGDEGRGPAHGDEAGHGQAGRGRAGAAGQGHPRRGRVPGQPAVERGRRHHRGPSDGPAAALPAGPGRGGVGEQQHHAVSAAAGHVQAFFEGVAVRGSGLRGQGAMPE